MRVSSLAIALLWSAACTREQAAPAPTRATPSTVDGEEEIAPLRHPTAAFAPSDQGSCARAYRLVGDTCVHRLYEAASEPALAAALAAYKRGIAPPMLGPVAGEQRAEPPPRTRPDPGSLMRKTARADAGSPRELRLAELDAMLALAREKLRQRDEASKAKKVESAARVAHVAADAGGGRDALDHFAHGFGGAPPAASAAPSALGSGAPAAARLSELSQIASQLSGDQLKALSAEFGQSGLDPAALQAILAEARE